MEKLQQITTAYGQTAYGRWLNEFDWKSVPVEHCNLPFGIVGTYSFGKIKLLHCPDPGLIFPVYVHELRHRWQIKKQPVKYLIGKLYRPLIENDADEKEHLAEQWYMEEYDVHT